MKHLAHHQFWRIAAIVALNGLFFTTTNPLNVPSFVLIISFALLAVTLYLIACLLLRIATLYGLPLQRHRSRVAAVISGLGTALVALQSIGQLRPHDVLVVLPLCFLTYLYVSYNRPAPAT